jgi:hypothetical protein
VSWAVLKSYLAKMDETCTYKVICNPAVGPGTDPLGAVKHPKTFQIERLFGGREIPSSLNGE